MACARWWHERKVQVRIGSMAPPLPGHRHQGVQRRHGDVRSDLACHAFYILIGVVWEAHQLISIHIPGAYAGILHDSDSLDRTSCIYFSFVTLTTVGYGNIPPVTHAAGALAILEALIGQLYSAIVLGRLVSLHAASGGFGTTQV